MVPKKIVLLILLIINFLSHSQNSWNDLSGKQKDFFYIMSRKIENIKPELFHLFEFTDSIPWINDTLPDYPYISKAIVNDSSKLILHQSDFFRKNNGLVSDLALHYATWELDLILQFRESEKEKYQFLKPKLKEFEHFVLEKAPQIATQRTNDGKYELTPTIRSYFSPNLNIIEKIASLKNIKFNKTQKVGLIRSIQIAQEKYLKKRTKEIIILLGGNHENSNNYVLAAGDGSDWTNLESIYRSKYNRPLPDPKSLFRYELITKVDAKDESKIEIKDIPIININSIPNLQLNIHIDAWTFNKEHQNTIIIQKGGKSYILYGNESNRFVSPDSSFGEGTTYWRLIDDLENNLIAVLNENIYGKKGFDFWIEEYEKRIEKTKMKIKKTEKKLNDIRHNTQGKPKMKKKKSSKKAKKKNQGRSYQDGPTPRGELSKSAKKRLIEQTNLIAHTGQLDMEITTLKQLKIDKENAFLLLSEYNALLDEMKGNMGFDVMPFTLNDYGIYEFSDGVKFDPLLQDIIFPEEVETHSYELKLLSFSKSVLKTPKEEVFVHFNISNSSEIEKHTLSNINNVNPISFNRSKSDSLQILEFFNLLKKQKPEIQIKLFSYGIGTIQNGIISKLNKELPLFVKDSLNVCKIQTLIKRNGFIDIQFKAYSNKYLPSKNIAGYLKFNSKHPNLNEIDYINLSKLKAFYTNWNSNMEKLLNLWLRNDKDYSTISKNLSKLKPVYYSSNNQKIKF